MMHRRCHRVSCHAGATGFTLVEVMVALGVLSLIMLATVTALRTFANTQSSIERLTARVDEIRTVSSFLRDTLESATQGEAAGGLSLGGQAGTGGYLTGNADAMAWKSLVLFGEAYGGEYILRIAVENGDLVMRWHDPMSDNDDIDWAAANSRRLIPRLQDFAIAYRADAESGWQSSWEDSLSPALVRLRIKTRDRYWPDLILRVPR